MVILPFPVLSVPASPGCFSASAFPVKAPLNGQVKTIYGENRGFVKGRVIRGKVQGKEMPDTREKQNPGYQAPGTAFL